MYGTVLPVIHGGKGMVSLLSSSVPVNKQTSKFNYLLTYDSNGPMYNRFHRGEWITWASGGEGALDTPGPLNGTSEATYEYFYNPSIGYLAADIYLQYSVQRKDGWVGTTVYV